MTQNNIVFLYAEVTPYLMGCINSFCESEDDKKIYLFYLNLFKNINPLPKKNLEIIPKNNFKSSKDLILFIKKIHPKSIIVSGRMDKDYLEVARLFKNSINVVTVQDTIYTNSLKQLAQSIFSNYLYRRYFNKFWGIGSPQTRFAQSLGFKKEDIMEGFYVADKIFFNNTIQIEYNNRNDLNLLFIGRLVKEKNIIRLIEAIETINNQSNSKNILVVIGEGEELNKILKYNSVKYLGLKSQTEIIKIAKNCDVFCLPSKYEPWGVVVHEMAAMGLPILSSLNCGSSFDLVKDGINGFKFNPNSKVSIIKSINKFISLSKEEKLEFSKKSKLIASKINHEKWIKTLNSYL